MRIDVRSKPAMATHRRSCLPLLMLGCALACSNAYAASADPGRYDGGPAMSAPGPAEYREIRAQLTPRRYTTLAAEIGAKVNRVPVPEGGRFQAGDTLVSFDCSVQKAQLDKAKATLAGADKVWTANKRLRELNSVGSVEMDVSEAEVNMARAEVAAGEAILSKCSAQAPFSGRVAEQKVREQQFVQPGQALLEIIDDTELELEFIVPSRWLAWVKQGHAFRVAIDETGRTYPAKVRRVGARVDPVSQSIKLTGVVEGSFKELMAGMSGRVLMSRGRR